MKYVVTGGAGFIGINLINKLLKNKNNKVLNIDSLTYASNSHALKLFKKSQYQLLKVNIIKKNIILRNINKFKPNIIFHLAAESHVDNSIVNPSTFIKTNVLGTYSMLECAKNYYDSLNANNKKKFRFIHISTDEVYGSIFKKNQKFNENSIYKPNSPYSASKASSDHFVRAWFKTFKLPIIITNCSNNYGPYQNNEKLIPTIILNAIANKEIGIYGNGKQIRDWIHVSDHVNALIKISKKGLVGEKYNIGANKTISNINLTIKICKILDKLISNKKISSHINLIKYIKDRPGHDLKYALNTNKINSKIKWYPKVDFEIGLLKTIKWYISENKFKY
tara:strand:+ start:2562 stop:3569 length:1008 start_codon:yes stop_codon:yes gene_type:complete